MCIRDSIPELRLTRIVQTQILFSENFSMVWMRKQILNLSLIHISGSVSVLGLMNDSEKKVQLLIDEDVMKEPYLSLIHI